MHVVDHLSGQPAAGESRCECVCVREREREREMVLVTVVTGMCWLRVPGLPEEPSLL